MTKQPMRSQGWCQFTDRQGYGATGCRGQGNLGASAIPLVGRARCQDGWLWHLGSRDGTNSLVGVGGLGLGVTAYGVHS